MAKSSGLKNAPAKTGERSGKGRGNALTAPRKTPPPAPKTKIKK